MAEANTSAGKSKSRSVLGDITNRVGKRGISAKENSRIEIFDFNDKYPDKRIRVSPRPCSEVNFLKGNVISGLSKIPNENKHSDLSGFESSCAVPKSSTDVYNDCDGGRQWKNILIGSSKFQAGDDDIEILNLGGVSVASQSVNELVIVDSDIKILDFNPNLKDGEEGKVLNSTSNEADVSSQLELASYKENKISGTTEVVGEDKHPSLEVSARENVVDLTISSGCEFVVGSSKMHNKENDSNFLDLGRIENIHSINTEANEYGKEEFGDSFTAGTSTTVSETGTDCGKKCDAGEVNTHLGGTQHDNYVGDNNADNFVLSQSGSVDGVMFLDSQESRVFGIDRSTKLKEDECADIPEGSNSIGACSCSFCTKAAYIWLNLHQKDIKARLSAMKKSQKDASILAERSGRIKVNEKHGAESITGVSNLESHLMHQWRSLFQRMADIWEAESNQLFFEKMNGAAIFMWVSISVGSALVLLVILIFICNACCPTPSIVPLRSSQTAAAPPPSQSRSGGNNDGGMVALGTLAAITVMSSAGAGCDGTGGCGDGGCGGGCDGGCGGS